MKSQKFLFRNCHHYLTLRRWRLLKVSSFWWYLEVSTVLSPCNGLWGWVANDNTFLDPGTGGTEFVKIYQTLIFLAYYYT